MSLLNVTEPLTRAAVAVSSPSAARLPAARPEKAAKESRATRAHHRDRVVMSVIALIRDDIVGAPLPSAPFRIPGLRLVCFVPVPEAHSPSSSRRAKED